MALLFMGAGAVLEMTGRSKFAELGGLYRYMPITFWLYMVGAFSISGFPLFSGFVSKTMVIGSTALVHQPIVWLLLEGAAIGTFLVAGLKLPYLTWFAKKEPVVEAKEPPKNMLAAMSITAFLCVFIGVYPHALYRVLPNPVDYAPYTAGHLVGMSQLLLFTFVGFWLLRRKLHGERMITLDIDWFYRIAGKRFIWFCEKPLLNFADSIDKTLLGIADSFVWFSKNPTVASRIMVLSAFSVVARPFNPGYMRYERDLEELRRLYPEEMQRLAIGTGVLLVLMFFSLYLLIYLTYGVLWT